MEYIRLCLDFVLGLHQCFYYFMKVFDQLNFICLNSMVDICYFIWRITFQVDLASKNVMTVFYMKMTVFPYHCLCNVEPKQGRNWGSQSLTNILNK
ncbi:unnamed protein product [Camellia sinensis]